MNFTESFEEFSSRLTTTDLALYAGIGVVLFILFKDRLSPVQQLLLQITDQVKKMFANSKKQTGNDLGSLTLVTSGSSVSGSNKTTTEEDLFFKLVASWKETRDLAVRSGCTEAIKVADQMFPFLSPMVCNKKDVGVTKNDQTN